MRALRVCVAVLAASALVVPLSSAAEAAKSAKKPKKAASTASAPTLATLKIIKADVTIKVAGKTKYVKAKDGQVLRQGDALSTDAAGVAQIDYTDGSLTRLGASTEFKITVLTNKRGGRQTQGTLTIGDTWNRAAEVAQTGSFEVKAGGATAAVEGTAFSMSCSMQNGVKVCKVIDVVDNVRVSIIGGATTQLTPATSLEITNNTPGTVTALTYEDLANNPLVVTNLYIDFLAGKGLGGDDLPPLPLTLPPLPEPPVVGSGVITPPSEEPITQPTAQQEEPTTQPTLPTLPSGQAAIPNISIEPPQLPAPPGCNSPPC